MNSNDIVFQKKALIRQVKMLVGKSRYSFFLKKKADEALIAMTADRDDLEEKLNDMILDEELDFDFSDLHESKENEFTIWLNGQLAYKKKREAQGHVRHSKHGHYNPMDSDDSKQYSHMNSNDIVFQKKTL